MAIVIAEADEPGDAAFLLTRRTPRLRAHGGQWALPGGRVDPGETIEQTALRELHEELGVLASTDDILGTLDDYPTRSGYLIAPVVVWAPGAALSPNPSEVAGAYRIGCGELFREGSPEIVAIVAFAPIAPCMRSAIARNFTSCSPTTSSTGIVSSPRRDQRSVCAPVPARR